MTYWLLAPATLAALVEARRRVLPEALAGAALAAAEEPEARDGAAPRNLTVAGSTAEIRVDGVLTKRRDLFAEWFGGGNTTYASIRQALATAITDPAVKSVVLAIDSPGGSVDGLFETLDAIASARATSGKSIRVRAENAQSAAYAIAAAAGPIEAVSRASSFGSIGTAVSFYVDPDVVTLTNTDSPDKRPDVTTDEGRAVVVKYLDQVNDELVRAIARGRDVDVRTVAETFGRGASLTAPHAKTLGMIDRISTPLRAVTTKERPKMEGNDDNDARASAATLDATEARGVASERKRVLEHLELAEMSGDMAIALEAIRAGDPVTVMHSHRHLKAAENRADRRSRQSESDAATAAVGAGSSPVTQDLGDQVVAIMRGQQRSFVRG